MRSLFIKLLLFITLICISLATWTFLIKDVFVQNSLLGAYDDKQRLLVAGTSSRIIFIGGSNASFGIDSKMIEDSLGLTPINTALHAGLGLQFMLNNAKEHLQPGDVVVISPEYDQFVNEKVYKGASVELLQLILDVNNEPLSNLTMDQKIALIKELPSYYNKKFFHVLISPFKTTSFSGVYDRSSFNHYGDVMAHWNMTSEKYIPVLKFEGHKVLQAPLEQIREFKKEQEAKNVRVVIFPPPFAFSSFKKNEHIIAAVNSALELNDTRFLVAPSVFGYADSLFFNTAYHLNRTGVTLHTQQMIRYLKGHLDQ